jgi:hypothetical protein
MKNFITIFFNLVLLFHVGHILILSQPSFQMYPACVLCIGGEMNFTSIEIKLRLFQLCILMSCFKYPRRLMLVCQPLQTCQSNTSN